MSADHKKPVMAFVLLVVLAATVVSVQFRADAFKAAFIAAGPFAPGGDGAHGSLRLPGAAARGTSTADDASVSGRNRDHVSRQARRDPLSHPGHGSARKGRDRRPAPGSDRTGRTAELRGSELRSPSKHQTGRHSHSDPRTGYRQKVGRHLGLERRLRHHDPRKSVPKSALRLR